MSRQEKATNRLLSKPTDYSWGELTRLMQALGYSLKKAGGSGRKFAHNSTSATLFLHEPHPSKVLKGYQVRDVIQFLKQEKHIQ